MHHFYKEVNITSRYQPDSSPSVLRWLTVLRRLQAYDDSGVLDEASDMESLSPRELKQIYNIQVEMRADNDFPGPGYTADEEVKLQAYALDLVKRYFSAYDPSLNKPLAKAPVRQLQHVFEVVLDTLCQKTGQAKRQVQSCERHDEPGDDFDKELFQLFAWKYGKLFAEKLSQLGAFPPAYGYFGEGSSDDEDYYDEDYDEED